MSDADTGISLDGLRPIPERGLLLHVGVFKTGTTALQESLRSASDTLASHGVTYHGPASWQWKSLLSLLGTTKPRPGWLTLESQITSAPGRAMVSSENLCGAKPGQAAAVVGRLGEGRPVTVLMTIRPHADLLASTWQQFLKAGFHQGFGPWLHETLDEPGTRPSLFWRRNDFPAQVAKWGELVGPENVIVVMSDKTFPRRNLAIVERLLDVPEGTVPMLEGVRDNRTMTWSEAQMLRQINARVLPVIGRDYHRRLVRLGAFPAMYKLATKAPDPIPVPRWAAEKAAEIGREQAAALKTSGAVLIGDVDVLGTGRWTVDGIIPPLKRVRVEIAVAAAAGGIIAARRVERADRRVSKQAAAAEHMPRTPKPEPPPPTFSQRVRRRLIRMLSS